MRRLLIIISAAILLGCADDPIASSNVFIVNSAWEVVRSDVVSRAIDSTDALQADIDEYNATHTDDMWRLYTDEVPAIEEAPQADAWIVDAATHTPVRSYLDIERADLKERREAWRIELDMVVPENGGKPVVLYVDRIPPAVAVPEPVPVDPYIKWALYIIDDDGNILHEYHATDQTDYNAKWSVYIMEVSVNGGTVIAGRLYP